MTLTSLVPLVMSLSLRSATSTERETVAERPWASRSSTGSDNTAPDDDSRSKGARDLTVALVIPLSSDARGTEQNVIATWSD